LIGVRLARVFIIVIIIIIPVISRLIRRSSLLTHPLHAGTRIIAYYLISR